MAIILNEDDIQLPELGSAPTALTEEGSVIFYIDNTGTPFTINPNGSPVDVSGTTVVLGDLTDITITTPSNDQILRWRTDEWVNEAFPTVSTELNDLSDVTTTGINNGDLLMRIDGSYQANVLQPAILAINDTSASYNDVTGTTTLANALIVDNSSDGNVTNYGDTSLANGSLLSGDYFQSFDDGDAEVLGPYQIVGHFGFTAGVDGGSHIVNTYAVEIDTGVVTVLEQLDSVIIPQNVTRYINVAYTVQPATGKEYTLLITTVNDFTFEFFHISWRKLGHAIA